MKQKLRNSKRLKIFFQKRHEFKKRITRIRNKVKRRV